MKNDLNLVIDTLEAEKKRLQKMIRQCASEHDNLLVYHHSETLLELNHHLRVLYSFKDPLHNQWEELKRMESFLRNRPKGIKNTLWKFLVDRDSEELQERKLELEKKQKEIVSFNDTQEIDNLLFAIADGKIDTFKIVISLYDDVEILFTRETNLLLISIGLYEPHEADFVLNDRIPNPLKGLGFRFDADKSAFIYRYDLANFKDAGDIKVLLSRLFFDVFRVYDVRQSIVLKYREK